MESGISGKVALVSGGSRGIGRACAEALAREQVHVVISYSSNEAAAAATVDAIRQAGGHASSVRFDVSDPAACQEAVENVQKEHGRLDILVNNAGIALDNLLVRYKNEDLQRIFATNVFGPFYLTRAAARAMMKARWGRVIMMGSVVGSMGNAGQAAYSATKSAVEGMMHSVARELASRGITANLVAPGFIETDMTHELPDAMRKAFLESIPLQRMGYAEEVADAVCFLASERAKYITGQVIHVNGGLYM
jgi:3-oxoacyl-[acyl-carrier protein] reductase